MTHRNSSGRRRDMSRARQRGRYTPVGGLRAPVRKLFCNFAFVG